MLVVLFLWLLGLPFVTFGDGLFERCLGALCHSLVWALLGVQALC